MSWSDSLVLAAAAVLALVSSMVLVGRYRRSVVRLMSVGVPAGVGGPVNSPTSGVETSPDVGRAVGPAATWRTSWAATLGLRRRLNVAIAIGSGAIIGVSYALLWLLWNDLEILPFRVAFLAAAFTWPAVPAVWIASDGDRRWTGWAAGLLLAAPVLVALLAGAGPLVGLGGWVRFNGLATVVVAAFLTRAYRAVGICLLAIWLLALIGAAAADANAVLLATVTLVLVLVVFGGLAFAALSRWYAMSGFSDHMLLLGSLCLVFCLQYVSVLGLGNIRLLLIGLALFVAQGMAAAIAYLLLVPRVAAPPRLLVLRVFGHGRTTGRLLDKVSAHWRHLGPVCMIGGPDLAAANLEPDEFLAFMSGGLRRRFVATGHDLTQRLAEPEGRPDPDGRYRVEEWFCFDGTWRPAVEALLARSDVVLMDLRGFTPGRAGTRYELEVLARTGAFRRTVAVVDPTTDAAFLEHVLAEVGGDRPRTITLDGPDPAAVVRALAR